jgi:P-type Cu+ transporter
MESATSRQGTNPTDNRSDPQHARDPVCGMTIDPKKAAGSFEYQGETYYFCSTHCLQRFRDDPERFLNKAPEPMTVQPVAIHRAETSTSSSKSQKYTCPMHPEVRSDKPGSCPKCGMALEPISPQLPGKD